MDAPVKSVVLDDKAAAASSGARKQKWLVAGGIVAALVVVGVTLGVALPLTLNKDNSKEVKAQAVSADSSNSRPTEIMRTSNITISGPVREYFIAAEYSGWTYASLEMDNCTGKPFSQEVQELYLPDKAYRKALFRAYSNADFEDRLDRPAGEEHLGFLGPVIRAVEGEFIRVILFNSLDFPISIEPSGIFYEPPMTVEPSVRAEFIWEVKPGSLPSGPHAPSSQMFLYRSSVDILTHVNAGLVGPLVITRQGQATKDARPVGVDRELFTFFHVTDENIIPEQMMPTANSNEAEGDAAATPSPTPDSLEGDEQSAASGGTTEQNLRHGINGQFFCNLPNLTANFGDKVRWYVAGLGNEVDLHTAHWHGITLLNHGRRVDQVQLLPGVTHTLDSEADNPGTWLFHCHVNSHMKSGMMALYHISGPPTPPPPPPPLGKTRKHFISADIVEWDYAPSGGNLCAGDGVARNFTEDERVFLAPGKDRIGRKNLKTQFVEYTDATFSKKLPRTRDDLHLGLQGPLLRAEVGDVIEVLFRNAVPGHTFSMHPHGVHYNKASEGAPYNDGTTGAAKADDAVAPNTTMTYVWHVPVRAGPGPADPSSVFWMYHSHTDEQRDTYSGLFGGIVVTRAGAAKADGAPKDVDRELVFLFSVLDEGSSRLLGENARRFLGAKVQRSVAAYQKQHGTDTTMSGHISNGTTNPLLEAVLEGLYPKVNGSVPQDDVDGFAESNLKHSINGYMYCNLPGADVVAGERVRMYFMTLGDTYDLHSPVMQTAKFEEDGRDQQGLQLLPGSMLTTDISPAAPGAWVLHCQVDDHVLAGMRALINVTAGGKGYWGVVGAVEDAPVKKYYISAEEYDWDYAPLKKHGCTGQVWNDAQQLFTNLYVGSVYRKARYVQYTDSTWKQNVTQPGVNGFLGPVIRAEVGDVVEIVFRNSLDFPASLRFQGGLVPVDAAGKLTSAGVSAQLEEGVAPGKVVVTRWVVPQSSGPADNSSVPVVGFTYVSGVDEIAHTHAGLVGVALVGGKGVFGTDGQGLPAGYDFVTPLLFTIVNENNSPFYNINMKRAKVNVQTEAGRKLMELFNGRDLLEAENGDPVAESNLKHAVNGGLYCNLPFLKIEKGRKGVLVLVGMGSEFDMHSPVFEGQVVASGGRAVTAASLMPASTRVVEITGGEVGRWKAYCFVQDHIDAGMMIGVEVVKGSAGRRLRRMLSAVV